jgi:hypothetical protein
MVHNLTKCAGGHECEDLCICAGDYVPTFFVLPGSDEGKWCTTYLSVPEAVPEKTGDSKPLGEKDSKIHAFVPETMSQHFQNEEAEWC